MSVCIFKKEGIVMLLMQEQKELIGDYHTLKQASEVKGTTYDALRM
jgi:hypothetical protein